MAKIMNTNMTEKDLREIVSDILENFFKKSPQKQDDPTMKDILNAKEAAGFLDLAITTLYGLTSDNKVPHFKRGKKLYFRRSELLAWIEEGRIKTREELDLEAESYLGKKNVLP